VSEDVVIAAEDSVSGVPPLMTSRSMDLSALNTAGTNASPQRHTSRHQYMILDFM